MTLGDRIVVMKDGVIQQADTPLETYNHPVNRFVAGFIGMPPMNFFDGAIEDDRRPDGVRGRQARKRPRADGAKAVRSGARPAADEPLVMVGELTLPGNGFTLPVPAHLCETAGRVGRTACGAGDSSRAFPSATAGRRERRCAAPIEGDSLNVIEPLGNDMDVYMNTPLHDHVVGRVEAQPGLQMDTQATVYVDLRKVHFFEPGVTGMNLSLASNEPAHAVA